MIVCDTGPRVVAALSNDADHRPCVEMFTDLHAARRELLVPATVVAEVGYLLAREAGARVESLFLRSLADADFTRKHSGLPADVLGHGGLVLVEVTIGLPSGGLRGGGGACRENSCS